MKVYVNEMADFQLTRIVTCNERQRQVSGRLSTFAGGGRCLPSFT